MVVIGAGNILNCSLRKMYNEDEQTVPRLAVLGETSLDANYHFACVLNFVAYTFMMFIYISIYVCPNFIALCIGIRLLFIGYAEHLAVKKAVSVHTASTLGSTTVCPLWQLLFRWVNPVPCWRMRRIGTFINGLRKRKVPRNRRDFDIHRWIC